MEWRQEMLLRFHSDDSRIVAGTVPGDETWICQDDPETKHQSTVPVFSRETTALAVKRPTSLEEETVATLRLAVGTWTQIHFKNENMMTAQLYTTVCPPAEVATTKNLKGQTPLRERIGSPCQQCEQLLGVTYTEIDHSFALLSRPRAV